MENQTTITFRPGTLDDFHTVSEILEESLADLVCRLASNNPTSYLEKMLERGRRDCHFIITSLSFSKK